MDEMEDYEAMEELPTESSEEGEQTRDVKRRKKSDLERIIRQAREAVETLERLWALQNLGLVPDDYEEVTTLERSLSKSVTKFGHWTGETWTSAVRECLKMGDADTMYEIGRDVYQIGIGKKVKLELGRKWKIEKCVYEIDNGIEKTEHEAYKWYKKAAEAGSVKGMASVGMCLLRGEGVKENQSEGFIMLVSAANQGSDWACFELGKMYFKGRFGVEINYASAKHWLEKAVAEGTDGCKHKHLSDKFITEAQTFIADCD